MDVEVMSRQGEMLVGPEDPNIYGVRWLVLVAWQIYAWLSASGWSRPMTGTPGPSLAGAKRMKRTYYHCRRSRACTYYIRMY